MKVITSTNGIQTELLKGLEPNQEFTLKEAYQKVSSTDKKHSIRARIYEGIDKGLFKKVSRGVYKMVDKNDNSVLLVNGDGRDLSMIKDGSIDCLITDHPYSDEKSNKGGNRNFAEYESFLYTEEDFKEKFRVLKQGAFVVEFFAEENENNFDYIYQCKKLAQAAGFEYYATVDWQKGSFVSNTGRKAKNSEQMVFFTKGKSRSLKLDAKKNLAKAKEAGIDVKGLDSYDGIGSQEWKIPQKGDKLQIIPAGNYREALEDAGIAIQYMKGTAKMLPTVFNVDKTTKAQQIHQAEKPVALFEELLEYITLPNELVLDQFAGSCNIGKACLNKGRNALLIEKDMDNFNAASKALEEHVA